MSDNTLPPVGATVEVPLSDGRSLVYTREELKLPDRTAWATAASEASPAHQYTLTLAWRLAQERDQLKAERDEARRTLEGVCMAADACVDALRDLAGDSHEVYIGAYDSARAEQGGA